MARTGIYCCTQHGGTRHRDFCIECLRQEKLKLLAQPYPHDKKALRSVNRQLLKCGVVRQGAWFSDREARLPMARSQAV